MPADSEGVIRFAYDLAAPTRSFDAGMLKALNAWRSILKRLELVHQDPSRYGGLGFGNLSARDPDADDHFVVTATQTGHLETLENDQFVRISGYNLERFWVEAEGHNPPSSESLTHASIYRCDPRLKFVFHGHSADIFSAAERLKLPAIAAPVRYGTPEMAEAVAALMERNQSRPLLFVSLGHEDGVFACGATARDTGSLLVTTLARALQ